jgi:hypothetical protein
MLGRYGTVFRTLIVVLLLCDLATLVVLATRLNGYTSTEIQNVIPLTVSDGATKVVESVGRTLDATAYAEADGLELSQDASMVAYDSATVWESETSVDIFSVSYDGTVVSSTDDKLIAPGTSDEYVFTLENTGSALLDYELTMEAYVTGADVSLPVRVSVHDHTGAYVLGDADHRVDVLDLNLVDEKAKLSSGRFAVYTLAWEWPYEGGDEYDTALGNLAVGEDVTLTIKIHTVASYEGTLLDYDEDEETEETEETEVGSEPDGTDVSTTTASTTTPSDGEPDGEPYGITGYSTSPHTGYTEGAVPALAAFAVVLAVVSRPHRKLLDGEEHEVE